MLTIANFEANYYLPQGTPDRMAAQKRLDGVVARLPEVLNGRLRPPASDETAVYRIRQLEIDLWIDALAMSDGQIARNWGRLLLQAVTRALMTAPPSHVLRYDDHAHFVAAFLGDLLAGNAWSRWVYDEFAPLRGLPVGQVAAQLLAARPALLVPVAQRLADRRQLELLIQRLRLGDLGLIWDKGLGFRKPPAVPAPDDQLERILIALGEDVALERGDTAAQVRNALRLYLAAAMAQPSLVGNAALGAVCHHLALLYQVWMARPAATLWTALANQEIAGPAALAPILASLDQSLAPARDWLVAVLATPAGRAYLAQLVPVAVPDTVATPGVRKQQVTTAFAGLALLLPVIRDLGLHEQVSREGLYQLLLTVAGRALQPVAWGDVGPAWLAGVPAPEMKRARSLPIAWPDVAQWTDPKELAQAAEAATDHLGSLSGSDVALLVLRRFAQRLRGFADSSPAYLAQQFINLPGYLYLDDETIEAYLSRAPLGVVLQMAGRDGDQGLIPWLNDRRLWIHLPGG